MNKNALYFIIIFLWCGLLFLFNLDKKGLWSSQEARNAIAARSLMEGSASNWIIPEIAFEKSTQKPVLFYWLVTLSCMIGREISAFWVRIPAALSGMLCVLYIFFAIKKIFNPQTGFYTSIILATSIKFLGMSRTSRIDIFLALCLTITLLEFYFYLDNRKLRHIITGYFFCALAVLSKGPVGLILPVLVFFSFCLATNNLRKLTVLLRWEGIAVFCLLTIPYYVAANYVTGGEFISDFIIKHNIERFTGGEGVFGSRKPFWFYIPNIITGALPWSVFIPVLFYYYKFGFSKTEFFSLKSKYPEDSEIDNLSQFLTFIFIWFAVIFVFFSGSSFKRGDYLLPVYPAVSILLGIPLAQNSFMAKRQEIINKWLFITLSIFIVLLNIIFLFGISSLPSLIFNYEIVKEFFNENDRVALMSICGFFCNNKVSFFIVDLLISAVFINIYIFRKSKISMFTVTFGLITSLVYFYYFAKLEPFIDTRYDLAPFAEDVKNKIGDKNVVMYHFWDHSLGFHIAKIYNIYFIHELKDYAKNNFPGYFIVEKKWYNLLPPEIKSKCVIISRTPDYHRKKLILAQYDINN